MRALCLLLLSSGCSLLYNGDDLKGSAAGRPKWISTTYTGADEGTTDLAAGDVDGDGKLDLVAIEQQATALLVYLGHGDGSFDAPMGWPAGCSGPVGITLADLDGDGMADAIVACTDYDTGVSSAATLIAAGGGGFASAVKFAPGGQGTAAIASGDLNGDGHPDVLIANATTGGIALFRGEGDGSFAQDQLFHTGAGAGFLELGDLNGDGALDVVVTNAGDDTFSVLLNQGGTLGNANSYPTDNQPFGVAIGDFDKKNGPDVAIATFGLTKLDVTLNQGGGAFPPSMPTVTELPFSPARIHTADFDHDGKLDLVVGGFATQGLMMLYGKGDGSFEMTSVMDSATAGGLVVADFDGDGKPDIAVGGDDLPGNLTILLNR